MYYQNVVRAVERLWRSDKRFSCDLSSDRSAGIEKCTHCLQKQLIALKQKLLREFAEVLCLVERKYTLKYAETLAEAREQQTVAR